MNRYRNDALARALSVLHCLAEATAPLALSEVARRTRLSPATAFRYLANLSLAGYVLRDSATREYSLGVAAAVLAAPAPSGAMLRRIAPEALNDCADFNGVLHLAAVHGSRLFHFERLEVGERLIEKSCVGTAYVPLRSVAGRALLAGMSGVRRDAVLQEYGAAQRDLQQLASVAASLERFGFHHDALDGVHPLMCLAMPGPAHASETRYAACVTLPALRRNGHFPERAVERAAAIARRMLRALGVTSHV